MCNPSFNTIAPHDSSERYESLGVNVVEGNARIISPWEVEVFTTTGLQTLSTLAIVIAAGARPLVPPIPGIETIAYLTSDTIWNLREQPKRLLVLGGGPIGCELAQCFARLGSQVTIVEMAARLLMREDEDASDMVLAHFKKEGITVLLGHTAKQFTEENGAKTLLAEHEGNKVRIPFDTVLLALRPNSEYLWLWPGRTGRGTVAQTHHPGRRLSGDQLSQYLRLWRCRRALPIYPHGGAPSLVCSG